MDLNPVAALLALGIDPLYAFLVVVVVDDVLGVAVAVKTKTFDMHKLPSFLKSQFGTVEFLVVASAALAASFTGGDMKTAATALVVAGGGAMVLAMFKDIFQKAKALVSK